MARFHGRLHHGQHSFDYFCVTGLDFAASVSWSAILLCSGSSSQTRLVEYPETFARAGSFGDYIISKISQICGMFQLRPFLVPWIITAVGRGPANGIMFPVLHSAVRWHLTNWFEPANINCSSYKQTSALYVWHVHEVSRCSWKSLTPMCCSYGTSLVTGTHLCSARQGLRHRGVRGVLCSNKSDWQTHCNFVHLIKKSPQLIGSYHIAQTELCTISTRMYAIDTRTQFSTVCSCVTQAPPPDS